MRKIKRRLLLRQLEREFAVAHAGGEALDEFRDRVLAIGADEFGQRREQARLCEAVAIDALMARFRPGLTEIAERGLKLFAKEVLPVLKAQSSTKVREAAE